MPADMETVRKDSDRRKAFNGERNLCPCCGEMTLQPLGGSATVWIECQCGSYSPMKATYEEALAAVDEWEQVDPELDARMYPPVGG